MKEEFLTLRKQLSAGILRKTFLGIYQDLFIRYLKSENLI
jgi:hypothetical protein